MTTASVAWVWQKTAWQWPLARGTASSRSGIKLVPPPPPLQYQHQYLFKEPNSLLGYSQKRRLVFACLRVWLCSHAYDNTTLCFTATIGMGHSCRCILRKHVWWAWVDISFSFFDMEKKFRWISVNEFVRVGKQWGTLLVLTERSGPWDSGHGCIWHNTKTSLIS